MDLLTKIMAEKAVKNYVERVVTEGVSVKGEKGDTGPQGPKGDTGPQGPQGPKGDTGGVSQQDFELLQTEVSDLTSALNSTLKAEILVPATKNELYRNGAIGSKYSVVSSDTWRSIVVPAQEGDEFICKFTPARNTVIIDWVLFLDTNEVILDKISKGYGTSELQSEKITCPQDTAYVCVNAYVSATHYELEIYQTVDSFTALEQDFVDIQNKFNIEKTILVAEDQIYRNGAIGSKYSIVSSIAWKGIIVPAHEGDEFICKFTPSRNAAIIDWILFLDANEVILDKISKTYRTTELQSEKITCPANTAYVCVNAYVTGSLYKIGICQVVDGFATLESDVVDIQKSISTTNGRIEKGEIILPSTIYVAVGVQCSLNWSAMANVRENDASVYFEYICDIGRVCERGIIIDATDSDVGSHTLKIKCRDAYSRRVLNTYSGTLTVVSPGTLDNSVNILMIGDSRTTLSGTGVQGTSFKEVSGRTITATTKQLCESAYPNKINFIGSYTSTLDSSVKNLAKNGWATQNVLNELSNAGGITNYVESSCGLGSGASLDFVTVMLGINDISTWGTNLENKYEVSVPKIETYLDKTKQLIDQIIESYSECKIIIIIESTTCANQDSHGYFSDVHYERTANTEMEQALKVLRKRLLSLFDNSSYNSNVIISSAGIWCDRLYGFPYITAPINARASVKTVERFVSFLHPHDDGYKQIADGIYSTIVALLNQ